MFFSITTYENLKKNTLGNEMIEIANNMNIVSEIQTDYEELEKASKYMNVDIAVLGYDNKIIYTSAIDENFVHSVNEKININEKEHLITNKLSNEDGTYIIIYKSIYEEFKFLRNTKRILYMLSVVSSFIVGILSFMVSGIIIKPLKKILKVIEKMTAGHMEQKIPINSRDEIGELSNAFNQMSDKLKHIDSIRQEFVSNVSHELKTPLSSIKVLSESLLIQENVPEEMHKEFLMDITSEVDRLTEIIEDLLMLVRLDRKEVGVTFKTTYLNRLVEDVVKRLNPIANKRNVEINYEEVKEIQADIDEVKLSLAITNLIENAIKYNKEDGFVNVKLDSDHQNAYITVEDNGIGIPEEDVEKIFERFYRVDKMRDRETGGTGLGLSITYRTILLHKGHIKVTSEVGEGSTFVVRIPLKQND
ncbi:MAG: HAMP domain-containing histidine kinase [Clostridia bacterium]|jgi:signal transduction histidine kinase|nr:HAMP domain-containing histidine kinase [Clostridia bacterium]